MLQRALVFAAPLITATLWFSLEAATASSLQGQLAWLRTDSQRFEVHYLPTLARDVERVTRSADRAYDLISARLTFTLPVKVPLIMFAPSEALTLEQAVAYARSDQVASRLEPHRSRMVLPVRDGDSQLDALIVHELTHYFVAEIVRPQAPGDGGVPRWVHEGIANYMADGWSDGDERLMRELVATGAVPALSQLTGDWGSAHGNSRLNDALGHVACDYIESRWGPTGIRGFINALIVPRVDKTYDAVFDLTAAEFDAEFRQYAERRFGPVGR
jgi:hypothetical protein